MIYILLNSGSKVCGPQLWQQLLQQSTWRKEVWWPWLGLRQHWKVATILSQFNSLPTVITNNFSCWKKNMKMFRNTRNDRLWHGESSCSSAMQISCQFYWGTAERFFCFFHLTSNAWHTNESQMDAQGRHFYLDSAGICRRVSIIRCFPFNKVNPICVKASDFHIIQVNGSLD